MNIDLSVGEIGLAIRALRYYMNAEQATLSAAVVCARTGNAKDVKYAADVKRDVEQHIDAASELLVRLQQMKHSSMLPKTNTGAKT